MNFTVGTPPAAPTPISPSGAGINPTAPFTFSTVPGATEYMVYFYDYTTASGAATRWYTAAEVDPGNTGTGSTPQTTPRTPGSYGW